MAVTASGDFVVVWESDGSGNGDTSSYSIQRQRFASNSDPVGDPFLVNTYTSSAQTQATVAMAADGNFVVVWQSQGSDNGDTSNLSVQGQRFSSSGDPLGPQFLAG